MSLCFKLLTRTSIRALPPGKSLSEHGIIATRLKSGDVRYSVNIMVDGLRIHRAVGRESDGVTRTQAELAIETLRTKARESRLDLPQGRKTHRSFEEAATEYLQRLEATGGKDIENKRRHIDQQLIPQFGKQRADKVSSFDVQQYVGKRLGEGIKQATINRELSTLSHCMNRMVEWKWIKADDRPKIVKGNEPRKEIVVLSDKEILALMDAALADQDDRLHLFVAFGLNAAMRHSEILAVRYEHIDFDRLRIFIPKAKAGARQQPITPSLASKLAQQRKMESDKSGWVFPSSRKGKHPHCMSMDKGFRRAVVSAKLDPKRVTPHVMRHTAITRLVQSGTDLPTIQSISGHKTLAMVMRYVHLQGEHINRAIATLDLDRITPITPKLHTAENEDEKAEAA